MKLKEYDKAIAEFTKSIELDSDQHGPFMNRAVCYRHLTQDAEAIEDFKAVLERKPSKHVCLSHIGKEYFKLKEYDQSIDYLDQYLGFEPDDLDAQYCKSFALKKNGEYELAYNGFDQITQVEPRHAKALREKANCSLLLEE